MRIQSGLLSANSGGTDQLKGLKNTSIQPIYYNYMYSREDSITLIEMMEDIPTLPDSFIRIKKLIGNEGASAADLAKAIRTDHAVSACVLKVANSAYYNSMGLPVATLTQAVARLGFMEASHIIMASSLLYGFTLPLGMNYIRALWAHAFAVGVLCERLAKRHHQDSEELFMAGLLHDIGRAIIGIRLDLTYFESNMASMHAESLVDEEVKKYGIDHAEAGALLLHHWDFPEALQRTVAEHHKHESTFLPARICALADGEANRRFPFGSSIDQISAMLAEDSLEDLPELPELPVSMQRATDDVVENNRLNQTGILLTFTPRAKTS